MNVKNSKTGETPIGVSITSGYSSMHLIKSYGEFTVNNSTGKTFNNMYFAGHVYVTKQLLAPGIEYPVITVYDDKKIRIDLLKIEFSTGGTTNTNYQPVFNGQTYLDIYTRKNK